MLSKFRGSGIGLVIFRTLNSESFSENCDWICFEKNKKMQSFIFAYSVTVLAIIKAMQKFLN